VTADGGLHVVVMAKYPVAGRVKTRLAARLGNDGAATLQTAFLRDLAARLAVGGHVPTWAVDPPDAPFAALIPGARTIPQRGAHLGARMGNALADVWADGVRPTVLLGADLPHLPLERLDQAARALAGGADVVLGPALDGGYYLLALARPAPSLFGDLRWGGPTVLTETRACADAAGLRVAQLAPERDVDTWDDLLALAAHVAAHPGALPHTAAALAALDVAATQ